MYIYKILYQEIYSVNYNKFNLILCARFFCVLLSLKSLLIHKTHFSGVCSVNFKTQLFPIIRIFRLHLCFHQDNE